jgi:DNA-binding winged helix-turn-helix (wHTH) protein/DNA polymerase III delta prime subunit
MDPAPERLAGIAFGRFQVSPDRREVLADGQPIKLGGRAFDVLMALIEARGAVVSRHALMARVWPGRIIEENSLAAQIAALRAAFGAQRELIRTVSGRGYQFTGEIHILSASPNKAVAGVATAEHVSVLPSTNVPKPVSELVGREEERSEILNLVTTHRLVTVIGAGGIGKTTLALALARELRPHCADGVWLAEFSALAERCRARHRGTRRPPRRSLPSAHRRKADGSAAASGVARDARLELRAARRARRRPAASSRDLRRPVQPGGGHRRSGQPGTLGARRDRGAYEPGREIACRGGGRGPGCALPPPRHAARLCARKARGKRRTRPTSAAPRRILPQPLRAGGSRMGNAADRRMARRLRLVHRQFARGARPVLFTER